MAANESPSRPVHPPLLRRWLRRGIQIVAAAATLYGCFLLLGFVPLNWPAPPPPADDYVTIFVRSNEIHTDLVLPVACDDPAIDWHRRFQPQHFSRDVQHDRFVAVGWGNRAFYVETPTWADFKLTKATAALFWPSETVLHVEYLYDAAAGDDFHEVRLTREQYADLARFVESSIASPAADGAAEPATTVTYGTSDRFYVATGRYHLFNTCNKWTGRGLARAGAPVGIWTPLKPHVLCWLPEANDE
jgi:uncharacterized protein (TIGR02117 family)